MCMCKKVTIEEKDSENRSQVILISETTEGLTDDDLTDILNYAKYKYPERFKKN